MSSIEWCIKDKTSKGAPDLSAVFSSWITYSYAALVAVLTGELSCIL